MSEEDLAVARREFADDPDVKAAQIGLQLQKIMGTQGGKYLEELAEVQISDGVASLLTLDPVDDLAEFRATRLDVLVAQRAITWILNGIAEGEAAAEKVHEEAVDNLEGFREE